MTSNRQSADALFDLRGKRALVTGASSGLGAHFARTLAVNGADVAVCARRVDLLEEVAQDITSLGRGSVVLGCDVTDEAQVDAAVTRATSALGGIDILVNNAGISRFGPADQMPEEDWDCVVDTNLKGYFLMAKHTGRRMIEQGYGRIVNIGSLGSLVGSQLVPAVSYSAAKTGIIGLTRDLATHWASRGITVNTVAPGWFDTELTEPFITTPEFKTYIQGHCPMARVGRVDELDGALLFLASDASSYVTGQTLTVDGGFTTV